MASVFKYGKMEPSTRANGRIIKLTGRVPSGTQMVTTMRASFATINQMAMVYSTALMEQFTRESGSTISNMVLDRHIGQMVRATSDTIWRGVVTALAHINGQTVIHTVENGLIML